MLSYFCFTRREINPSTEHAISAKSAASRRPRLTLDRPVWLTIRVWLVMLGGGGRKGIKAGQMGACRSNLGQSSVLGLSPEVVCANLMLFSTVIGQNGETGGCWRSQRTDRVGARAERCLARCGRHFGSIYSPRNRCSRHPNLGYTLKSGTHSRSHGRAVSCGWWGRSGGM